ncbi:MAG TPA: hypothetical protein VM121_09020 [Acidimicrobiales bacterium]|nr:hypothetical protein [Acidimicrobiales bacterium]
MGFSVECGAFDLHVRGRLQAPACGWCGVLMLEGQTRVPDPDRLHNPVLQTREGFR